MLYQLSYAHRNGVSLSRVAQSLHNPRDVAAPQGIGGPSLVVLGTENLRSGIQEALQTAHTRKPEKDELGEGPLPISRSPRLEAGAVDITVTISTERDQIFVYVVTQPAS
jgi:hypothetical protein